MTRIGFVRRALLAERSHPEKLFWATLAVALPTLLRLAIDGGANGVPFVTYFPAIMLAALFLDWRYAALTALASVVVAKRVFMGGPMLFEMDLAYLLIAGMFFLSCALLVVIGETLRRAVRQLDVAAKTQEMLSDELRHRVRNVLTVVQSIATMTWRNHPDDFRDAFSGRLTALARASDLLAIPEWQTCRVPELVDEAVKPFAAAGNIRLAGPPCRLPRECCVPTMLALHELCTNAIKHGALSVPEGRVDITWTVTDDAAMALVWRETGGPTVAKPARRGMGTRLLVAQSGLDAVTLRFAPDGVECHMRIDGAELLD